MTPLITIVRGTRGRWFFALLCLLAVNLFLYAAINAERLWFTSWLHWPGWLYALGALSYVSWARDEWRKKS